MAVFGLIPAAAVEREELFRRRGLSYASVPPRHFGMSAVHPRILEQVQAMFARPSVPCPDEWVVRMTGVAVVGGHLLVTDAGKGIAESFANAMEQASSARMAPALATLAAGQATVPPAGLPLVHLYVFGGQNYGHLLVDILPRLVNLAACGVRRFAVPVPEAAMPLWPVLDWVAARLGLEAAPIPCGPDSVLRPAELIWAGPVSHHNPRKSPTLRMLAERLAPPPSGPATRRLFVTRPPGANRAISNQAELEAAAAGAGWEVVEPSGLPFPEQIALFAGAARVFGPLGAGLCNAMFMPQGGRLSMIAGVRFDVFFWDLACALGLSFDWVFTEPLAPYHPDHLWRPITLNLDRLPEALAWLEEDVTSS